MVRPVIRAYLVLAFALTTLCPATLLAVGGPRSLEVTAASCAAAKELAGKKAADACAKHGGVAWTEYSLDCDTDTQLLPGVPISLQVHFLCGADL